MKKQYFSELQIMCLSGRTQELCSLYKINFEKNKRKFLNVIIKQHKAGKADMSKAMEEIEKIILNGEKVE